MQRIFFIISLTFSLLIVTNLETKAQEQTPSYQSLISQGDKEYNNQ